MRPILLLLLGACSGAMAPSNDPWDAARALPTGHDLVPESDAVLPPWFEGALELPHGASLTQDGRVLTLHTDAGERPLGELLGRPSADKTHERVVFPIGDNGGGSITLLSWDGSAWVTRALVSGDDPPDRASIDPDGERVAFAWAGPQGGVAGVWVMGVHDSQPRKLTNTAPFVPGHPPKDFVPMPVGLAPRWSGDRLIWRSEAGEHSVEVK